MSKTIAKREVVTATSPQQLQAVHHIRHQVFELEDGMPACINRDGYDESSTHKLLYVDGKPVGCTRLRHVDDQLGRTMIWERMALLPEHRGIRNLNALSDAAQGFAAEAGYRWVIAIATNPSFLKYLRRRGFRDSLEAPLVFYGHDYHPIVWDREGDEEAPVTLRHALASTIAAQAELVPQAA